MNPDFPQRRALLRQGLAAAVATTSAAWSGAQGFPSRPIQLVLPFPPGGSFDPILRALSAAASKELGQPIVLMHRPGAGGITGPASVAVMNEADGHTLAVMHNSVIRAPLVQKVNWDPLRDFSYVMGLFQLSTAIAVHPDAPWKTLADLIADGKKRPGEISWGNVGAISVNRITAERMARAAGARFNMIPYKGGAEAWQALLGKQLDVYGDPGFGPQAMGGKVRLLASFTDQRLRRFPDVPTTRELGHDFSIDSPVGLVTPKNLPAPLLASLQSAFQKAAQDPAYLAQLDSFDMAPRLMSGADYAAYAGAQFERDRRMLADIGFKPE